MNRQEFNAELSRQLRGLPEADLTRSLEYYNEMIDDRMEDGMSETEAVAALGPVDQIVRKIAADVPIGRLVRQQVKPKRQLQGWEIALLIIGAPLWLPLVLAAVVILLSLYVTAWSLVLSLFAVALSFGVSGVAGIVGAVTWIRSGGILQGLVWIGAALILAGLAIVLFWLAVRAAIGLANLIRSMVLGTKSKMIRGEAAQR